MNSCSNGMDSNPHIRFVYSTEDSLYQYWQGVLLYESMANFGNESYLTALVSCKPGNGIKFRLPGSAVRCHDYSVYRGPGYEYKYVPRNKPYQLREYLETHDVKEPYLAFLDPDFVQIQPFHPSLEDLKQGICGFAPYMNSDDRLTQPVLNLFGIEKVESNDWSPSIVPYIFSTQLWRDQIVPLWCKNTDELIDKIYQSRMYLYHDSWFIEMWSFCITLYQLGLTPKIYTTEMFCYYCDQQTAPFLHYCHPFVDSICVGVYNDPRSLDQRFVWFDKRYYQPWQTVLPSEVKIANKKQFRMNLQSTLFLEILNACAKKYRKSFPSGVVSAQSFDSLYNPTNPDSIRKAFDATDFQNLFNDPRLKHVQEIMNAGPRTTVTSV